MKILKSMQKVPAGLMTVPLLVSAALNTFCRPMLLIGDPLTAVFTNKSTMTICGIMLLISGIQTKPSNLLISIRRGGFLTVFKIVLNAVVCMAALRIFGRGGFLGISTLAFGTALVSFNPALFIALMHDMGDDIDRAGYAWYSMVGMPFLPICVLEFSGGYGIDVKAILATVLMFILGMILGKLDPDLRPFTKDGLSVMLPFLGISMGSNVNLRLAGSALVTGTILFVIATLFDLVPLYLADRLILKQKGYCGAALSAIAGLSIAVPALITEIDPAWAPYAEQATAQLVCAVVLSAVAIPYLARFIYRLPDKTTPAAGEAADLSKNRDA